MRLGNHKHHCLCHTDHNWPAPSRVPQNQGLCHSFTPPCGLHWVQDSFENKLYLLQQDLCAKNIHHGYSGLGLIQLGSSCQPSDPWLRAPREEGSQMGHRQEEGLARVPWHSDCVAYFPAYTLQREGQSGVTLYKSQCSLLPPGCSGTCQSTQPCTEILAQLSYFDFFLYLIYCVCLGEGTHTPLHMCGSQGTMYSSWFFPSSVWAAGTS